MNDQLRDRITETFGDWQEIARHEDYIEVIWNFCDEGLGIAKGTVDIDKDGYYGDYDVEATHNNDKLTVCIQDWSEAEREIYLMPNGEWSYAPHWFSPKRARTLKNKLKGRNPELLYWYQL